MAIELVEYHAFGRLCECPPRASQPAGRAATHRRSNPGFSKIHPIRVLFDTLFMIMMS